MNTLYYCKRCHRHDLKQQAQHLHMGSMCPGDFVAVADNSCFHCYHFGKPSCGSPKAHINPALPSTCFFKPAEPPSLSASAAQSSLLTLGTWDGARQWLTAATRCEQLKLYCQVMLGFELQTLRKAHNITPGGDRKSNSHGGNLIPSNKPATSDSSDKSESWEEILHRETGLSQSTAYRFMDMATAAAPRLKKIPALRSFDPTAKPIAQLPPPEKAALEKAVHKLTDNLTQKQFGEQMGLWKKPQGSGATGRKPGDGGSKKLSLAEQAELFKLQATEDWSGKSGLALALAAYNSKFTCLTDTDVLAQVATLEQALNARRAWLKQPANSRDPKPIAALFS